MCILKCLIPFVYSSQNMVYSDEHIRSNLKALKIKFIQLSNLLKRTKPLWVLFCTYLKYNAYTQTLNLNW